MNVYFYDHPFFGERFGYLKERILSFIENAFFEVAAGLILVPRCKFIDCASRRYFFAFKILNVWH